MKIRENVIVRHYFNAEVARFMEKYTMHDREIIAQTLNFLRETYPEIAPLLLGELIQREEI